MSPTDHCPTLNADSTWAQEPCSLGERGRQKPALVSICLFMNHPFPMSENPTLTPTDPHVSTVPEPHVSSDIRDNGKPAPAATNSHHPIPLPTLSPSNQHGRQQNGVFRPILSGLRGHLSRSGHGAHGGLMTAVASRRQSGLWTPNTGFSKRISIHIHSPVHNYCARISLRCLRSCSSWV
jgi:hypothetical protein